MPLRRSPAPFPPAGGGTSQTAVNRHSGARTQLAELVTAASTVLILLFVAPVISLMPQAALGAVVIAYSLPLIQPKEFAEIRRIRTMEFRWAVIAFAAVTLGALIGGAAVPALGVYGAELFPTGNRGRANGLISVLSLIGSSVWQPL